MPRMPAEIVKTYPVRGPMQQHRLAASTAFHCFRCGASKKSKLVTVFGGEWSKILCNGCYGRLLSIYEIKAGTKEDDQRAEELLHAPLAFVYQYIGNLKQYRAISMDVGDKDGLKVDAAKLHEIFDTYGIPNTFEIYPGTHTSAVAVRFQNWVMPFFGKNLCASGGCQ